jgi:hypothetical protein
MHTYPTPPREAITAWPALRTRLNDLLAEGDLARAARFVLDNGVFVNLTDIDDGASTPAWTAGVTAHSLHNNPADRKMVVPTTPNGRVYRAMNDGTAAAVEPTWPTALGNTVLDGSIIWRCELDRRAAFKAYVKGVLAAREGALDGAFQGAWLA